LFGVRGDRGEVDADVVVVPESCRGLAARVTGLVSTRMSRLALVLRAARPFRWWIWSSVLRRVGVAVPSPMPPYP